MRITGEQLLKIQEDTMNELLKAVRSSEQIPVEDPDETFGFADYIEEKPKELTTVLHEELVRLVKEDELFLNQSGCYIARSFKKGKDAWFSRNGALLGVTATVAANVLRELIKNGNDTPYYAAEQREVMGY